MGIPPHKGLHYIQVLKHFHTTLQPEYYLEIGSASGQSLSVATCNAIAIDPRFSLQGNICQQRKKTLLFQQTSDEFFKKERVSNYFPHIDMAFLDGLHLFEFALRDFINIEPHLKKNAIVFVHDCLPLNRAMAKRIDLASDEEKGEGFKGWWTGDTWKLFYILKERRPDLVMKVFDAPPTGLLAITNFNPSSTLLGDAYFELVRDYGGLDEDEEWLSQLYRDVSITPSKAYCQHAQNIMKDFWL